MVVPEFRGWIYSSSRIIKSINAAFEIRFSRRQMPWLLPMHIYIFLVSALAKECQGNWILRNFKENTYSRIKEYTFLFKKEMLCLKQFFASHNFQTWFHDADHLLYNPQIYVSPFLTFLVLLYQFPRKGTGKEY